MKVIIIGSGIGGLASACLLAKKGYEVQVLEKNEMLGGRLSIFEEKGYRFDMGPSWYLMPDVFEHFYDLLGEKVDDHLHLVKLSPSYRIFFKDTDKVVDCYSDLKRDLPTVEALEKGASEKLKKYLALSEYQYNIALQNFMYKNYDSWLDFINWRTVIQGTKLSVFQPMHKYVSKFFHSEWMQKIMQYHLVFLGSSPYNTPALYNIMSHIDFNMGVFYPEKGIYEIINSLKNIGEKYGVQYKINAPVKEIVVKDKRAVGVTLASGAFEAADIVISNADIHHTETRLLAPQWRSFKANYWEKKVLAPSGFILYLGIDGKIDNLVHHNLIFSKDWRENFDQIFARPQLPTDPSFYVCAPSKTDSTVAPEGKENLFVLVPIAAGLDLKAEDIETYKNQILDTMATSMKIPDLRQRIEFERIFTVNDFQERYNSYRGSALGLAHTFMQTAIFRPNNVSKKVANLYYVGANTNPGIGMPICMISAELVLKRILGDKSSTPLRSLS